MGAQTDFILEELEDLQIDEIIKTQKALQRKFKAIGVAENEGDTEAVPSDACCDFLIKYQARLNERYNEYEDQAFKLVEVANALYNAYMDQCSGKQLSLDTLLVLAGQPSAKELGIEVQVLLLALDKVAQEDGMRCDVLSGPAENSQHPEWASFVIARNLHVDPNSDGVYDFVIQDIIDKVESEL